MNASFANQKIKMKLHRKILERIKKSNEKNFVNLCESNFLQLTYSDLARTFIPVESTKQHKN